MKSFFLIVGGIVLGIGITSARPIEPGEEKDIFGIHHTPIFNIIMGILLILIGLFAIKNEVKS